MAKIAPIIHNFFLILVNHACAGRGGRAPVPQVRGQRRRAARGPAQLLLRRAGLAPGDRAAQDPSSRLCHIQVRI